MAKRAVTFAEHINENVLEDVPQRHIVFTIPKRLRVFFKYDRALLSILFKAAWKALSEVLGFGRELSRTVSTSESSVLSLPHRLQEKLLTTTLTCTVSSLTDTGRITSLPPSPIST